MKRHGSPVVNGEVRYLSVSAVEKAKLCLRRYYYHYVVKIEETGTDAQARGRAIHSEIEVYLKTGLRPMSSDVLAGMHMIPPPGDDLFVEHDLAPDTLEAAVLRADGIPFIGSIDLMHARGTNEGTMDIEEMLDPANTITVGDWKSCRILKYIKLGPELVETTQMSGYAKYAFDAVPEAEHVRLFHGYFPIQGLPRKTTALVDREDVEQSWKRTVVLARSIRDAVRETNPDLIDANTDSCRAFGRDCPARKVCTAGMHGSLAGAIARMNTGADMSTVIPPNGLLSRLTKKPVETVPTAVAAPGTLTPEQIAAERERLRLLDLVADIDAVGLGFPALSGEAATAVTLARKQPYSGSGLAGTGELAEFTISEVADLEQVLVEARSIAASRAAEIAAGPPEVVSADSPEPTPAPKYDASAPVVEPSPLDAMAAKADAPKRRGRKPKTAPTEPVAVETPVEPAECAPEPVVAESTARIAKLRPTPQIEGQIDLYIDCSTSFPTTSLWPTVHAIVNHMNEDAGVGDFRLADDGRGTWRGVLAQNLRENVVPGVYSLDGAAGEIAQVVIETLRAIVDRTGGAYVRGAR